MAVAILAASASAAHAALPTSLAIYSDNRPFGGRDLVGGGRAYLFTPANARIEIGRYKRLLVHVGVTSRSGPANFDIGFSAASGHTLRRGVYYDPGLRDTATKHPSIDVSGNGHGCNDTRGGFEVRDIARTRTGALRRLWIVWEHHCDGIQFGELRWHMPSRSPAAGTMPAIARWPSADRGEPGSTIPVTLRRHGRRLRSARVSGPARADYKKVRTRCFSRACKVWLRFTPQRVGTRRATLVFTTTGGGRYTTKLEGFAHGGTTRALLRSEPGDELGEGKTWAYTPSDAGFSFGGTRHEVDFELAGNEWSGYFEPPPRDDFDIRHGTNSCGSSLDGGFTVTHQRYDRFGHMTAYGVDFEVHCERGAPALHGTLRYRVGDSVRLAPWMLSREQ